MSTTAIVLLVIFAGLCVVVGVMVLMSRKEETVASRHFPEPEDVPEGFYDDPKNLSALDVQASVNDTLEGRRHAMRADDTFRYGAQQSDDEARARRRRRRTYADEDEVNPLTFDPDPVYPDVSSAGVPFATESGDDRWRRDPSEGQPVPVYPETWSQPGWQPGEPRTGVQDLDRQYGSPAPAPESPAGAHSHGHAHITHHSAPDPSPATSAPDPAPYTAPDPPSSGGSSSYDSGSSGGGYDSGGGSSW